MKQKMTPKRLLFRDPHKKHVVGDVFDALTSKRDYPKYDGAKDMSLEAMPIDKAFSILDKDKGTHFDPVIVTMALNEADELSRLWQKFHLA